MKCTLQHYFSVWTVQEQVTVAALDCQDFNLAQVRLVDHMQLFKELN